MKSSPCEGDSCTGSGAAGTGTGPGATAPSRRLGQRRGTETNRPNATPAAKSESRSTNTICSQYHMLRAVARLPMAAARDLASTSEMPSRDCSWLAASLCPRAM